MPEIQDIFRLYGEQYKELHSLSYAQSKVFSAILKCRTADLGALLIGMKKGLHPLGDRAKQSKRQKNGRTM